MPGDFLKILKERSIVFDGATGTMLQKLGLKPGGCPDELNLVDPGIVARVHSAYKDAGSDVVTTNTFGANRTKLKEYKLEARLIDINVAAARNARKAVGNDIFVAGGLGPTGRFVEPVGDMGFDEALAIFVEQAQALKQGGVDLFIIETMMDIKEMKAAIMAAKAQGLPVVATMTFDDTMRSVLGTPPEVFAVVAESLGADCVGANCSLGIEGIYRAVSAMSNFTTLPLIAQPNAGIPTLKGDETVFPDTPEQMTASVDKLVDAGVRVLGGCCGTTSDHIKMMGDRFRERHPISRGEHLFTALASRSGFTLFGRDVPPIIIGERINPTGRKRFAQEIKDGKTAILRSEARAQGEAGAHVLDINVGVPGIDESAAMKRAVFCVNENSMLPVVIDSANPEAIEQGLRSVDGKALVNSVSGEEKKLTTILPLVKKYGGAVLGLTLDDDGIPDTAEGRFRVAQRILERAVALGIRKQDVVIDCLAMTVSAQPRGALVTLEAIRLIRERLGLATVLGVSNISFGLPQREQVNASFLAMAMSAGLDSAIVNPGNRVIMDAYHASLVLEARDPRAERYIERFKAIEPEEAKKPKKPAGIKPRLARAIVEGDEKHITALVEEALSEGLSPMVISNEALIPGLEEVGTLFASNRYYLPQVMLSADTMKRAFERLKKEETGDRKPALGKVVMATVEGDIHDIGKNIVSTLLENHGFEVIDLGKNVPAKKIVEIARIERADIVGLSALMTTTVMEMGSVIEKLEQEKVDVHIVVGGAVVTPEFAESIGAQYGGDALSAVDKMKRMVGKG